MENVFTASTKTGDIVTKFPMASQIFKKYKIDFCCGGNRPIGEALDEKNLVQEGILNQLNQLYHEVQTSQTDQIKWDEKRDSELIDHVLNTHHAYLNETLPELGRFIAKIYRVHGQNHPELAQIHALFNRLKAELEHHMIQEEEAIFPKILSYEQSASASVLNEIVGGIETLESEHESSGNILKEIRDTTHDFAIPADACKTYELTYLKLEELESDLFQHIHLENNILFPRLSNERSA